MKKKAAKGYFITLTAIIIISFIFSFVGFPVPTTSKNFTGFLNAIPKGLDFGGGVVAVYEVEKHYYDGSTDKAMHDTVDRVSNLLNKNYKEPQVYTSGNSHITVRLPGNTINPNYLVGVIEFDTESDHSGHDHEHEDTKAHKLNGSHVDYAKYVSTNGVPTVWIQFTKKGNEILKEMTKEFSDAEPGTIYLYANKDYDNPLLQVQLGSQVKSGYIQLSGGSLATKASASEIVNKIQSGKIGTNMTLVGTASTIAPLYSKATQMLLIALFFLIIVLSFIYLYIRYNELGLVAMLSISVFLSLSFIILPLMNIFTLTLASLISATMLYLSVFALHLLFIQNVQQDYQSGKKFAISFKNGYFKSLSTFADFFAITATMAIAGLIFGGGIIKNMASLLLPGLVIAAFVVMVVFYGLMKWYLVINNHSYKKVNFNKAGNLDEQI